MYVRTNAVRGCPLRAEDYVLGQLERHRGAEEACAQRTREMEVIDRVCSLEEHNGALTIEPPVRQPRRLRLAWTAKPEEEAGLVLA